MIRKKVKKIKRASRKLMAAALAAARVSSHRSRKKRAVSRKVTGVALAAALVPYRFRIVQESGEFELRGLLWELKKESCGEQHSYTFHLLPFLNRPVKNAGAEQEAPSSGLSSRA